jgi:hypothetical protein
MSPETPKILKLPLLLSKGNKFLQKNSSQNIPPKRFPPKKFLTKIPPKKFLQKNSKKKNPKKIQKISNTSSKKILEISYSLHSTWRPKTLGGRKPFRACFFKIFIKTLKSVVRFNVHKTLLKM